MRLSTFAPLFLLIGSIDLSRAGISQDKHPGLASQGVPAATDYSNAVLPKDKQAAWQMLLDANGLHADGLKPWYMKAHYKTFDANGKPKTEGELTYLWASKNQWRQTFAENGTEWSRWGTENGIVISASKEQELVYPETEVADRFADPFRSVSKSEQPASLRNEKFGAANLVCFDIGESVFTIFTNSGDVKICSEPTRPILRVVLGDTTEIINKAAAFQGKMIAQSIKVNDGGVPVYSMEVEELRSMSGAEMNSLSPEPSAVPTFTWPKDTKQKQSLLINKQQPEYPPAMRAEGIQGVVRLGVRINPDGGVTILGVLHSPSADFTKSAEKAVMQWRYRPLLVAGKASQVMTIVEIKYTLGN